MLNALSLETLQRKAPSVFTRGSAESTSDKYQYISTIDVIERLKDKGFQPTFATQSHCRLVDKEAFTKHMIRFRHQDTVPTVGGLFPELVLTNSHDGLSSYRLDAGLYRLVCSNGMVAGDKYSVVRVRHQGNVVDNVIEGTYEVVETAHKLLEVANKMESITLTIKEQIAFAETAHGLRFDEESEISKAIAPSQFLEPRRYTERGKHDLFTVFNIIQENLMKGGVRGYLKNERGYPTKRTSTRAVNSIDKNITLNRALWTQAEKILELKAD